jgi:GNAT superfamily N-acetyltransferase
MLIREMRERDWEQIYGFFTAIVSAGETYAYPEGLTSEQARTCWIAEPPGQTVVALVDDDVVGSATMGANRPGRGSHVATASFMVDPAHQGGGIGRALGLHVLDWARSGGYRGIQFNAVVETNEAAVHLWQDLGFKILATAPEAFNHPQHGYVGLHLMFQQLARPGSEPGDDLRDAQGAP